MKIFGRKFTPLEIVIHLGAWIPLLLIVFNFFSGNLTVNPIQDIEQRTGRLAILWVVISLAGTPLASIFGWKEMVKRARTIGLYAFMMAAIHVAIFVALDYGFAFDLIWNEALEKNFIIFGAVAFIGLLLMAATSFKYWQKKLKKNWKRLHRSIYFIAPIIVLHYALAKKGDIFTLQGDVVRPFIYGLIVILLLVFRIKPIKKTLTTLRKNTQKKVNELKPKREAAANN